MYDNGIEDQGKFNLMIHSNFTPSGRTTPAFPGGIVANHSFNGTAEWAYGVTDWFEQGLYMPVYTIYSPGRGGTINGFKIRELFVRPHAHDQKFFYGVNFEFSVNYSYWEVAWHITSEVRPIVRQAPASGFWFSIRSSIPTHRRLRGFGIRARDSAFVYNFNEKWAAALEEYSDDGQLRKV